MENPERITKKQKKELRKLEWQEKAKVTERKENIKKYSIWAGAIAIVALVIVGLFLLVSSPTSNKSILNTNIPDVSRDDMATGNPKAKVTLIEYGDFQCPACAVYFPLVKQLLTEEKDKIYFVYRFFPLVTVHPNAFASDLAAYAAFNQGAFWEYHDILYSKQNDWSSLSDPTDKFISYAKELKLDTNKFEADMKSSETKKYVEDSEKNAVSQGINSTPTFFINKKQIKNPQNYEDFKKIVEDEFSTK